MMEDIKIKAFEDKIIELCNSVPTLNCRAKYYVLKSVADKLLEASERDIAVALAVASLNEKGGTRDGKGVE